MTFILKEFLFIFLWPQVARDYFSEQGESFKNVSSPSSTRGIDSILVALDHLQK